MQNWPDKLFELIYFPSMDSRLEELAQLAEPEDWDYSNLSNYDHKRPILYNYIQHTYTRLSEEDKILISDDGQSITFNTGLATSNQEPIFCYATTNRNPDAQQNWYFAAWRCPGDQDMNKFAQLPGLAHYFDDPSVLLLDTRKELRPNIDHIIADNKDRFPEPYASMEDYVVQTLLKGAIANALERAKRNYKTAVPQYYKKRIQLLLPLCLKSPGKADLALVVEDLGQCYRASTCLTLDMAYNNARQLVKPDRNWLIP